MQNLNPRIRLAAAGLLVPCLLAGTSGPGPGPSPDPGIDAATWRATADGLVVELEQGDYRTLRLQVMADNVIRVTATPATDFSNLPDTLMVIAEPVTSGFTTAQEGDLALLRTPEVTAEVALATGAVAFRDPAGRILLAEAQRSLSPVMADPGVVDEDAYAVRQQFVRREGEAVYGLGQQQDGRVNYAGENVELTTHNIEIAIPFLVSTEGYGLLWNNTAVTRFGDPEPARPLAEGFDLFDIRGNPGGLTVRYFDGDELLLEELEDDLDYQFLDHANVREQALPPAAAAAKNLRIE